MRVRQRLTLRGRRAQFFTKIEDEPLDVIDIIDVGEDGNSYVNGEVAKCAGWVSTWSVNRIFMSEPRCPGASTFMRNFENMFKKGEVNLALPTLLQDEDATVSDGVVGAAFEPSVDEEAAPASQKIANPRQTRMNPTMVQSSQWKMTLAVGPAWPVNGFNGKEFRLYFVPHANK